MVRCPYDGPVDPEDVLSIVRLLLDLADGDIEIALGETLGVAEPDQIEAVLDALPGIAESAVIGVAHEDFGETPLAVLVPEPGARPDLDLVRSAIRQELARYKHPSAYEILDALPRNAMGKVQKAVLRERFG